MFSRQTNRWASLKCAGLGLVAAWAVTSAAPAAAQRSILVDTHAAALTGCGGTGCAVSLNNSGPTSLNTVIGGVQVFSDGSITIGSGSATYRLFATSPGTTYSLVGGSTCFSCSPSSYRRADFINFYAPGVTTGDPNFQIQFSRLLTDAPGTSDLDVTFVFSDRPDPIPLGATIGFSGPTSQSVTNTSDLLLGTQATDSNFSFTFSGPSGAVFTPNITARYAAAAAVPEPATWALLLLGFAVVGGRLRRQRRAALGPLAA